MGSAKFALVLSIFCHLYSTSIAQPGAGGTSGKDAMKLGGETEASGKKDSVPVERDGNDQVDDEAGAGQGKPVGGMNDGDMNEPSFGDVEGEEDGGAKSPEHTSPLMPSSEEMHSPPRELSKHSTLQAKADLAAGVAEHFGIKHEPLVDEGHLKALRAKIRTRQSDPNHPAHPAHHEHKLHGPSVIAEAKIHGIKHNNPTTSDEIKELHKKNVAARSKTTKHGHGVHKP